jgi:hypothetical protein
MRLTNTSQVEFTKNKPWACKFSNAQHNIFPDAV